MSVSARLPGAKSHLKILIFSSNRTGPLHDRVQRVLSQSEEVDSESLGLLFVIAWVGGKTHASLVSSFPAALDDTPQLKRCQRCSKRFRVHTHVGDHHLIRVIQLCRQSIEGKREQADGLSASL